jgi:prepilin signal peptidase PulO-like enzyme (type II secretory pathway)
LILGFSVNFAFAVVLFPVLICLSFFDIDTEEIEYWCPITIAGLGAVALILSLTGVIGTVWYEHLIGAVVVSVPFFVLLIFGAMGGADVQLMAAAGLLLGWNIVPAAFIGIFIGAILGLILKVTGRLPKRHIYEEELPDDAPPPKYTPLKFGPCLAFGIAVSFLYGEQLIDLYLGFMGF